VPPEMLGAALLGIGFTFIWQYRMRDNSLEDAFGKAGSIPLAATVGSCLVGIFLCSGGDQRAFIYFQF
jgi:hypothetical protein